MSARRFPSPVNASVCASACELSDIRRFSANVDGTLRDTDDQYVDQLARWLSPMRFLFENRDPHNFARRVYYGRRVPSHCALQSSGPCGEIENRLSA